MVSGATRIRGQFLVGAIGGGYRSKFSIPFPYRCPFKHVGTPRFRCLADRLVEDDCWASFYWHFNIIRAVYQLCVCVIHISWANQKMRKINSAVPWPKGRAQTMTFTHFWMETAAFVWVKRACIGQTYDRQSSKCLYFHEHTWKARRWKTGKYSVEHAEPWNG